RVLRASGVSGGSRGGAPATHRVLRAFPFGGRGAGGGGGGGGAGGPGRPGHPRRAGAARRRRNLLGVSLRAVRRRPGVDARPGRVGHAVVGPWSRARPGSHRRGPPAQGQRSDSVRRRHRRVFLGSDVDPAGRPTRRRRVRTVDRHQHLPTGRGPPFHLARTVYVGSVPAILLARVGRVTTDRKSVV